MKKRSLALFLALLMLAGCSNTQAPKETEAANNTSDTVGTAETAGTEESAETETEETEFSPVPDVTFDGEDFGVLYRFDAWSYSVPDIFVDELTGDVWNDATYNRNIKMEDIYKFTFAKYPSGDPATAFKTDILGGLRTYDVMLDQMTTVLPMALENYCYDWNELTYVNTDDPWFDKNIQNDLSVGNKLYLMSGNVSISPGFVSRFLYFNKGLMEDYNLTAPYDLVREGKWTIDEMIKMVTTVSKDVNGDGLYTVEDEFGLLTEKPDFFLIGCGVQYTSKDENDRPFVDCVNEHTITAMEKIHELMDAPNATLSYEAAAAGQNMSGYDHMWDFVRRAYYTTDHFLFVQIDSGAAPGFADMDPGYGVLPNPKLTEEQDGYYHLVDQYSCAWAIPSDNDEIEKTDILFTAWNFMSDEAVEAYYEKTLKHKRMDSPDDAEMLDIIRTNTRYELSLIVDLGIGNVISVAYKNSTGSALSRAYKGSQKSIEAKIEKFFGAN